MSGQTMVFSSVDPITYGLVYRLKAEQKNSNISETLAVFVNEYYKPKEKFPTVDDVFKE